MNSEDAYALEQLLVAIEDAGGDVRDVEINSYTPTTPARLFSAMPNNRIEETTFTLEVAVGDLAGNPLESSDDEVRESVGIDVDGDGGEA